MQQTEGPSEYPRTSKIMLSWTDENEMALFFFGLAFRAHSLLGQPKILDLDRYHTPIREQNPQRVAAAEGDSHPLWRRCEALPPAWMDVWWYVLLDGSACACMHACMNVCRHAADTSSRPL